MAYKPAVPEKANTPPGLTDIMLSKQYVLYLHPLTAGVTWSANMVQYLSTIADKETLKTLYKSPSEIKVYGSKGTLDNLKKFITDTTANVSAEMRLNMYVLIALIVVITAFYFLVLRKYV